MRDPAALREFASRDWALLARIKEQSWIDHKRRHGPAGGIAMGDELRRHALLMHPEWPSAQQRRADLATHLRVLDVLQRTPRRGR